MKHSYFVIFLLFIFSCNNNKKIAQNNLTKCIENSIKDNDLFKIDTSKEVDIYKVVLETEKYFISNGYLKNNYSKKEYIKLVENIFNSNEMELINLQSEINKIKEKNNYNGAYIGNIVLQNCPHFASNKEKNSTHSIKKQVEALDRLYAFDPYNLNYIKDVINSVSNHDYKNVIYRLFVYTILSEYIEYRLSEKETRIIYEPKAKKCKTQYQNRCRHKYSRYFG